MIPSAKTSSRTSEEARTEPRRSSGDVEREKGACLASSGAVTTFSFNFDLDDGANDDFSSDSDSNELQIDVSEVDSYEPPSKHRRETVEAASVLNEMEEEIERQLDAKAAKTNLTATNVKNILKHVITNEHVMAMVRKRLFDAKEDVVFEPKLTRAKAKELAMARPDIPWPITPVKKSPASEVQALIEEELSEDSSDEEYKPEQDQQSEDEREAENSVGSDADSQPPTPAAPEESMVVAAAASAEQPRTASIRYDDMEGVFKVPGVPHVPTEEESIGQRTRSKLCLSETPLEQIEQAFVPPDITTDMYDWDCEVDEDWDNFLKEFMRPLTQELTVEDDPEADPEYNVLEEEETELLDKEELRMDKAVKVTRKELNNLVAELFEFADMFTKQEQEVPKKKRSADVSHPSTENTSLNNSMVELIPALAEPELPKMVNVEQRLLLATHFQQHVQLMTQHFAMTYMHPELHGQAKTCKDNLKSIRYLSNGPGSAFNAVNLSAALRLVADWEAKFVDPKFREGYARLMSEEIALGKLSLKKKLKYVPQFHPALEELFVESEALMYPQLLPKAPLRCEFAKYFKTKYLAAEENLIAIGLEQFVPFAQSMSSKFAKSQRICLMDAVKLTAQYLVPCRGVQALFRYIEKIRRASCSNPIKHYFVTGNAPKTIHCITRNVELKAPKDRPIDQLPERWRNYLKGVVTENPEVRARLLEACKSLAKSDFHSDSDVDFAPSDLSTLTIDPALRNPIVNMMPTIRASAKSTDSLPGVEAETDEDSDRSRSAARCSKDERDRGGGDDDDERSVAGLRKTTPRLAKIRSAQNMKLMAQVLGAKGPSANYGVATPRGKRNSQKGSDASSVSTKGDNEDEIAELMLASTTIKKQTTSRKKAKQARELENIKRLFEAENEMSQEERATKFAASCLQKLHTKLESSNPENFKAVVKLCLDYGEKLESIAQQEAEELSRSDTRHLPSDSPSEHREEDELAYVEAKAIKERHGAAKDRVTIELYREVCERLEDYPELRTDFLLFLKPHQAAMIEKSVEHAMLRKMSEFVHVAQIYFTKQPSRLAKIMQAITQLASDPYATIEKAHAVMGPVLKGHPLVMDLFLQVLPSGKPPESLFAPHMFENLTCPLGPHDKNKIYAEDASELYENIEMPLSTPQEDPYGGDNCKCECHNLDDPSLKTRSEHCVSCGTRFLNGRVYLQTSEGLRPAKVTFPGADVEKLENIARVSLRTSERLVPASKTRRRRKSSKNESGESESSVPKPTPSKGSPLKECEEASSTKARRGAKSPPKSLEHRRTAKETKTPPPPHKGSASCGGSGKRRPASPLKTKREERAEKRVAMLGQRSVASDQTEAAHSSEEGAGSSRQLLDGNWPAESAAGCEREESDGARRSRTNSEQSESLVGEAEDRLSVNLEKMEVSSDSGGETPVEAERTGSDRPWTRQEDTVLLQGLKREYSESTFCAISEKLGDRTVQQVKERCQLLLSLLQQMV